MQGQQLATKRLLEPPQGNVPLLPRPMFKSAIPAREQLLDVPDLLGQQVMQLLAACRVNAHVGGCPTAFLYLDAYHS
jgi:hypothetical protein